MNSTNCNKPVLDGIGHLPQCKYTSVFKQKAILRLPARIFLYHEAKKDNLSASYLFRTPSGDR